MASYNQRSASSSNIKDDKMKDPSAGALFSVNYRKHEDLKNMLDQNKDSLKLEAMKRIIGMIARGKNASMLFPAVVKNVACKNIEVKKLVYVYLERYAEEQQDLALLSISTFQRGLKDSNQMIRASALRVLSSVRVSIIVPIMLLAIKEGVSDMCPFVRKTAAHAIPKLYSLDKDQKENLIEIIDKILGDRTTLVAGSVVMAFEEVCPDRIDLIHRHFRKLCNLIADVDEWGQIAIISMLTRYARTQFLNPNANDDGVEDDEDKPFYEDSDEEEDNVDKPAKYVMDHDHKLLLKATKSLLQSRNSAVVMAVSQLYYHVAPRSEFQVCVKALIRLLRGRREVQYIVLQNIASISLTRKKVFGPYLKSFYVRSTDPSHIKMLKLEVLTNLATETNIPVILREFQTYVKSSDKKFVACTIQAIARCATNINEVTDTCLQGLVNLLSNRDESVVAESVVVIKKLLQMNPKQHSDIIKEMSKLLDQIQVPMARASIVWLIGEYCEIVPKIAPDVLRKQAKVFVEQEQIVKLQIINLAAKLYLTNSKQTKLITQYVLQLAKYDSNYDIRDRARFIKHLIMPQSSGHESGDSSINLRKYAKKILLASKPAPVLESQFKGRDIYQIGSLSHSLNTEVNGYQPLPEFPLEKPDPTVRNVEPPKKEAASKANDVFKKSSKKKKKEKSFYSSTEEEESGSEDSSSGSEEESDSEESSSEEDSSETEGPDSHVSESDAGVTSPKMKQKEEEVPSYDEQDSEEGESESSSEKESSEAESSEEESSEEESSEEESSEESSEEEKSAVKEVNLLDLDDFVATTQQSSQPPPPPMDILTPQITSDLAGLSFGDVDVSLSSETASSTSPSNQPQFELLHRVTGEGLEIKYRFTRTKFAANSKMVAVELEFINHGVNPIRDICIGNKKLQGGLSIHDFEELSMVENGKPITTLMGIDFNDSTQILEFDLRTKTRKFSVNIKPPLGELVEPWNVPQNEFLHCKASLSGMNENKSKIQLSNTTTGYISDKVLQAAHLCRVPSTDNNVHRFAGKTLSHSSPLLVTVEVDNDVKLTVNCEKMVIGSMLFTKIKECLQ